MPQASIGFCGATKFGNSWRSTVSAASGSGARSRPRTCDRSASSPHSPPDSLTAAARTPAGRRLRPSSSSVSTSCGKSSVSITSNRRSTAENASAEPTTAPVCATATRCATADRPTLRQATGMPAVAAASSAAANASGRRTVSRNSPTARVPSSATWAARKSATSRFSSPPSDTTRRKPTRGPSVVSASAIEPDCARTPTSPGRKDGDRVPIQGEPPGAARPMQLCPRTAAPTWSARARSRATTSGPSAPASLPIPGTTKARMPSATACSKASSTRRWPTSSTARSGGPSRPAAASASGVRASNEGRQRRPSTSSRCGCTPIAGTAAETRLCTASGLRGDGPTTTTPRGRRIPATSRNVWPVIGTM